MKSYRQMKYLFQIQFDQITWSAFTFLANLFIAKYYSLEYLGLINLILIFTYANLNVVKSKYVFPNLVLIQNDLAGKHNSIKKIKKRTISVVLFLEGITVWNLIEYLSADILLSFELTALFLCISVRDVNRTVNIFQNNFLGNSIRNTVAICSCVILNVYFQDILDPIEIWLIALLISMIVEPRGVNEKNTSHHAQVEKNLLDSSKQRLLVADSIITQLVNIVSSFIIAKLNPAVMGNIAVNYICIAAVATTIGTGITGKINLNQLNSRISPRSIFRSYLIIQSILFLNLILILVLKPIVQGYFGNNFSRSDHLILFVFLLYSTILLAQFYAFPIFMNCSYLKFVLFRLVSFCANYFLPIALVTHLSVKVINLTQLVLYLFLLLFARRSWI